MTMKVEVELGGRLEAAPNGRWNGGRRSGTRHHRWGLPGETAVLLST